MRRWLTRIATHLLALGMGVAAGIYLLPILIEPPAAEASAIERLADQARFHATMDPDIDGSDWLHWGEGTVHFTEQAIAIDGRLSPGPDYALYLVDGAVSTAEQFTSRSAARVRIGRVAGFGPQIIPLDASVRLDDYQTMVIWCEAFEQFITAARYRRAD